MGEIQMKPIVCTGAMDAETLYLIGALADAEPVGLGPWKCVRGMLDGFPTVIVRTNQGMANAAAATALLSKMAVLPRAALTLWSSLTLRLGW